MKCSTKLLHLFQRLLPILLCLVAVGGLLVGAQPASADTVTGDVCMQQTFGGDTVTGANRLNCTANDIAIARAKDPSPSRCTRGEIFDLTATFEIRVNASERYDAGFYFRTDGGPDARGPDGTCSLTTLDVPPPTGASWQDLDGDFCGDFRSAGTVDVRMTIPDVVCEAAPGTNLLRLPNCTSWHNNRSTACTTETDAVPETKSKCKCDDNFTVEVSVEAAEITVEKTASPTTVPETGGTVTYTVEITNNASFESVTISSIIDDLYGNIGAGSPPGITDNTCPDLIGVVLGPGETESCSFKAFVEGQSGDTVTDVVEACATQNGRTSCDEDDADVHITDIFTEPTLDKTALSSANCQLDVTYQVVVSNNSEIDELTVNSLTDDKFGTITTPGGNIVNTTCSVPQTIAPQGNYTCSFVGRITSTSCTFTHTDTVTGNVTDDDGVTSEPSDSATVTVTTTP